MVQVMWLAHARSIILKLVRPLNLGKMVQTPNNVAGTRKVNIY